MDSGQRADDLAAQIVEGSGQRLDARNQHIIMAGLGQRAVRQPHGFAQAAADAVANDGIADLLGDGEAETGRFRACRRWRRYRLVHLRPLAGLQHETALMLAAALGGGEEVGALFQARNRGPHALSRESGK